MTRKNALFFLAFIFAVIFPVIIFMFCCEKEVAWDYSIRDKLQDLKQHGLITGFENFRWEYDFKSIASFDIKFSNGKTGGFRYAKLVDGKIVFESLSEYDGYNIQGYMKYKDGSGITNIIGYYKLFNFYTVEDVLENLSAIDKVIGEMPVINRYSPSDIHKNDFLQKLPDKVRYEDDDVEVIFFKFKR